VNVKFSDLRSAVVASGRPSWILGTGVTASGLELVEIGRAVLGDGHTAVRGLNTGSRSQSGRLTIGAYASLATDILKVGEVTNRLLATTGA